MLARSGPLPDGGGWSFEVKWDGFRAVACTRGPLRVRSRRGWDMTQLVPELDGLPADLLLDGELVGWGEDGLPSFPALSARVLHGRDGVAVTYFVFDLLALDGESTMAMPFYERRRLLDGLDLNGPAWKTVNVFDDGEALFDAVVRGRLEGVVAKRLSSTYRPGAHGWVKVKNRGYWRYPLEREAAIQAGVRLST
jgi:bifunctional non-homologous end joining protein LigD